MKRKVTHPRRRGRTAVGPVGLRASLVHRDVRRRQDRQDRRRARAVHVPQPARVGARHGARRERRDAALGRRVGRCRRTHGPRRHARVVEARRQGRHHRQPGPQPRSIIACGCAACCGRPTASVGASKAKPSIDAPEPRATCTAVRFARLARCRGARHEPCPEILAIVRPRAGGHPCARDRRRRASAPRCSTAGAAHHGTRRRADRHHGQLGLADHRRLGLSNDHAGQRRRVVRAVERRRPAHRRQPGTRRATRLRANNARATPRRPSCACRAACRSAGKTTTR